jgi:hypothetical protein
MPQSICEGFGPHELADDIALKPVFSDLEDLRDRGGTWLASVEIAKLLPPVQEWTTRNRGLRQDPDRHHSAAVGRSRRVQEACDPTLEKTDQTVPTLED